VNPVHYVAYGTGVSSTVPLTPARPAAAAAPGIAITHHPEPAPGEAWRWRERALDPGDRVWLSVGVGPDGYRLRFEGGGDFVISADGRRIRAHEVGEPDDLLVHLLLDQVVPLALSQAQAFVLHASAVATDHGGVALVGAAGAGKSTLAAGLGACGCPVVADDALVVERRESGWMALPAYPGARVWPDAARALARGRRLPRVAAYTRKRRLGALDLVKFADQPVALRRIYLLDPQPAAAARHRPQIRPAALRDAVMALVSHTFLLDVDDPVRVSAHFDRAVAAAAALEVRVLTFQHRFAGLAALREAVLADLRQ
jgi:hypothetical protein